MRLSTFCGLHRDKEQGSLQLLFGSLQLLSKSLQFLTGSLQFSESSLQFVASSLQHLLQQVLFNSTQAAAGSVNLLYRQE
jgi:hypothetical protein